MGKPKSTVRKGVRKTRDGSIVMTGSTPKIYTTKKGKGFVNFVLKKAGK